MPWSRVVGQERSTETLARALASGRVAGTYLFHGPPGTGPRAAALAFAQALQCERRGRGGPEGDACGVCLACTKTARLIHPDVHVYLPFPRVSSRAGQDERPADYAERLGRLALDPYAPVDYRQRATLGEEGAQNKQVQHRKTPVDQFLRHDMTFVPAEGRHVVGILTDADRLRTEAANSLLKLLEEPAPDVVLVLTAERVENVLPTILSRCQRVRFDPLPAETIEAALIERDVAPDRAAFVARMADGSFTRALELVSSEALHAHRALALDFLRTSYTGRPDLVSSVVGQAAGLGRETLKGWFDLVTAWVRDLVLTRAAGAEARLVNVDQAEAVGKFVAHLPDADLPAMTALVAQAADAVEANGNATLVLTALSFGLRDAMLGRSTGRLFTPLDAAV